MSYIINAWLETAQPRLQVTHRHTGVRVIDWQGEQVQRMIECGAVDPQRLNQPGQDLNEVVRELFLMACLEGSYAKAA